MVVELVWEEKACAACRRGPGSRAGAGASALPWAAVHGAACALWGVHVLAMEASAREHTLLTPHWSLSRRQQAEGCAGRRDAREAPASSALSGEHVSPRQD